MKRSLIPVLAVAIAIAVVSVAGAAGPMYGNQSGYGSGQTGMGYNGGYGNSSGYGYSNLTPEIAQKYLQFEQAVLSLRTRILDLKIELLTLLAQSNPDQNAISQKQQEIYDTRAEIMQQAINFGIAGHSSWY